MLESDSDPHSRKVQKCSSPSCVATTSSTSSPSSRLLSLPRELRDLIYKSVFETSNDADRSIFISSYTDLSHCNGTSLSIIQFMGVPLLHTNKQIASEALEVFFKTERVVFACGPGVLLAFLKGLPWYMLSYLQTIELGWTQLPSDLKQQLNTIVVDEVLPLFQYLREETQIASLTVSLHFLSARRRRHDKPSTWRMPPHSEYNIAVATQALIWLFEGCLEEVVIRYEPLSAWSILEPMVDVEDLVDLEPEEWDLEQYESLWAVQENLWDLGYGVDLRRLVVRREGQPWHRSNMDEGIGEEVLITLRVPEGVIIEQDEDLDIGGSCLFYLMSGSGI